MSTAVIVVNILSMIALTVAACAAYLACRLVMRLADGLRSVVRYLTRFE